MAFNESQERDDHGRWTAGGAAAVANRAEDKTDTAVAAHARYRASASDSASGAKERSEALQAHREAAAAHEEASRAFFERAQNTKGAAASNNFAKSTYHNSMRAAHESHARMVETGLYSIKPGDSIIYKERK